MAEKVPPGDQAAAVVSAGAGSQPERAEDALRAAHARQQAIAELGSKALSDPDLPELLQEATALVARVLGVEYGKVLELLPDGGALLLRAGVGWNDGYVGRATVGADRESQAGYTLFWSQPVVVDDLRTETRFQGPPLLVEHGVVSGMSVVIQGSQRPFGVLGAHTTKRRSFTHEDVSFLQAIANVLALVIQRRRADAVLRAEEPLREAEAKWRALVEHAPDFIATVDRDGTISFLNRAAAGIAVDDVVKLSVYHYALPEYHDQIKECLEHIFEAGERCELEVAAMSPLGGRAWYSVRAGAISFDGRVVAATVIATDITNRKLAEETLRASEQRFAAAFYASPLGKCITDLSTGRFIDVNRQLLEILGYERDEIVGWTSVELGLVDASQREAWMEALQGIGGVQEHEIRIRRKSGEFRDVLVLFTMLEIGAEQCVFTIAKDVTELKREEEERRQSAERLRLLAENAQDIIFRYRYTDPPGWEYISPAVTRIGGYTPEEFYADPDQASKIVHPEDREAFDRMEEELQSGPVELRWVRKDGSIIWTEQRNTPVYDQGGNVVAMEGIVRDITERKRAEAALQEAREQLEAKAERHVRSANSYDLTFREVTVLHLIADGKADKEIASTLGISALTASKHVANILMKMQAASRTEAGVRAVREELIT